MRKVLPTRRLPYTAMNWEYSSLSVLSNISFSLSRPMNIVCLFFDLRYKDGDFRAKTSGNLLFFCVSAVLLTVSSFRGGTIHCRSKGGCDDPLAGFDSRNIYSVSRMACKSFYKACENCSDYFLSLSQILLSRNASASLFVSGFLIHSNWSM